MKQTSTSLTQLNARIDAELLDRTAINARRAKTTIRALTERGLLLANTEIEQQLANRQAAAEEARVHESAHSN